MGLFSKKTSSPPTNPVDNPKFDKIMQFCGEVINCYADDTIIDSMEIESLRRLADRLGLTKEDIAVSKLFITKVCIDSGIKVGMSKDQAISFASEILVQMLKI
jgi:hypothetical protein